MLERTIHPRTLMVATAFPDPPFDYTETGTRTGFDIELMRAICRELKRDLRSVAYTGSNFNGILDGLATHAYDAVISGTTITPERAAVALFSQPYLTFDQGVAVNRARTPQTRNVADLQGLTAGIQSGNTSDIVAKKLVANGTLAGIRYYPYDGIATALADLENGRIGCVIKLLPVISWLVKDRPALTVSLEIPTGEKLGIAFAKDNPGLCSAVDSAIDSLRASGEFSTLAARWFPVKSTRSARS